MVTPEAQLRKRIEQTLPKLNHPNEMTRKSYMDVIVFLVKRYDVYGKYNPILVAKLACDAVGIKRCSLRVKSRKQEIVEARNICMYYYKKVSQPKLTSKQISDIFAKDHATFIHSCKRVEDLIDSNDPIFMRSIKRFQLFITQHQEYLYKNPFIIKNRNGEIK